MSATLLSTESAKQASLNLVEGHHGKQALNDVSLSIPPCHAAGQGGPPPGWSVFRTC